VVVIIYTVDVVPQINVQNNFKITKQSH